MRYLLDTHAFIWLLRDDPKLRPRVRERIEGRRVALYLSAASVFEIVNKHRTGKLPQLDDLVPHLSRIIEASGLQRLPITEPHVLRSAKLSTTHKDPFDRILMAQALVEDLTFISNEKVADEVGVRRLW